MIKFRCRLISVVFLSLLLIPQNSYSQKKVRNIVVFFSFGVNIPAYQNILEGFKSTLLVNQAEPANLMIEYLDVGRSDNNEYARFIIDLYSKKYTNKDIDLLITIGPWINGIIEKYVSEIIKTTPVISIELDIPGIKLSDHIDKGNIVEINPK